MDSLLFSSVCLWNVIYPIKSGKMTEGRLKNVLNLEFREKLWPEYNSMSLYLPKAMLVQDNSNLIYYYHPPTFPII